MIHTLLFLATLTQNITLAPTRDSAPAALTILAGAHTARVPFTPNPINAGRALRADLFANALGGSVRHTINGHYLVTIPGTTLDVTDLGSFAKTSDGIVPLPSPPYVRGGILYFPFAIVTDVVPRIATGVIYDSTRTELRLFVALPAPGKRHIADVADAALPVAEPAATDAGDRRSTTTPDSSGDILVPDSSDTDTQDAAPSHRRHLVVVDAGHGGPDHGMTGPLGGGPQIQEKDITLAVALKTGTALRARGIDVVQTRTRDTLIALDDRGRIANAHKGDLFISIHVNAANPAWKDPADSRGFETYFLAEAKTEDARRVEQMENDAARFEQKTSASSHDPLNFIMKDMEQNEHLRESSTLAAVIQRHLADVHPGPNRGVKQAGFRVLVTTDMPAVLVEIGFGTNAAEARFLNTPSAQRRIANAIADAAAEYFAHYDTHAVASTAPVSVTMTGPLHVHAAGIHFQNPILLAAGTAAYGREIAGAIDLEALGGLVTKAVSVEPRHGAPAPRVAEFDGGMINAVGLANPGLEAVRTEHLPWLAQHLSRARVLVNVVGRTVEDFAQVVSELSASPGISGFELNVSCPNTKKGGMEFGADRAVLAELVSRARSATTLPLFVKLSPTLTDIAGTASTAVEAGADGITVVNTIPGLVIDTETRRPVLGFGTGGVSGAALRPVGVLAVAKVRKTVQVPIIGAGGIATADDVVQYMLAGATLVAVGTAALQNPRLPERLVKALAKWCRRHHVSTLTDVVGRLEWA